jgi:hypothetical protein
MKTFRLLPLYLLFLFSSMLLGNCKKEVDENDYASSTNMLKVFKTGHDNPGYFFKRPNGGYLMVYNKTVNSIYTDIAVVIMDDEGNTISNSSFGGTKNESAAYATMDVEGNVYVCGNTNSPELRMDQYTTDINSSDAYLAKMDQNGNLLWQRGYCDTTSPNEGAYGDGFYRLSIINNKIYCIGETSNWQEYQGNNLIENDTWMVSFDMNGNKLKQQLLPTVYLGNFLLNGGGNTWANFIKLSNNDLLIACTINDIYAVNRGMDTTVVLTRYNTTTDNIEWVRYYLKTSPVGDMITMNELPNGNIMCIDSYYERVNILKATDGTEIRSYTTGLNPQYSYATNAYWSRDIENFTIRGNTYVLGWYDASGRSGNFGGGAEYNNKKPWILKFDQNGSLVHSKVYDISKGAFYWLAENSNKNLQVVGGISTFGTKASSMFTVTISPVGTLIKPE